MSRWSRTRVLLAGLAVILLSNGVALLGVWWNRSGVPESQLELTQRELAIPYRGGQEAENSGLALSLRWRLADRTHDDSHYSYVSYWGGLAEWLDADRMVELGFSLPADGDEKQKTYRASRQLPREVLLVLELAGENWQTALARAQENAKRTAALAAANPGAKDLAERAKSAAQRLEREANSESRLFAIDAGHDLAQLRARYPDKTRYMVVRGKVRLIWRSVEGKGAWVGRVDGLSVPDIHVPSSLSAGLGIDARAGDDSNRSPTFVATLAMGQRLEPWLLALKLQQPGAKDAAPGK